jgi:hypothetical protein
MEIKESPGVSDDLVGISAREGPSALWRHPIRVALGVHFSQTLD